MRICSNRASIPSTKMRSMPISPSTSVMKRSSSSGCILKPIFRRHVRVASYDESADLLAQSPFVASNELGKFLRRKIDPLVLHSILDPWNRVLRHRPSLNQFDPRAPRIGDVCDCGASRLVLAVGLIELDALRFG